MGVTLSAATPVRLATNVVDQGVTFSPLAGGGFVALTDKVNGQGQLQIFSDAGAPVGKTTTLGAYSGAGGDGYGVLRLAGLTGGGFVAVTTDGTVHPGQTDIVARVYSAAGVLQTTLVVTVLSGPSSAEVAHALLQLVFESRSRGRSLRSW